MKKQSSNLNFALICHTFIIFKITSMPVLQTCINNFSSKLNHIKTSIVYVATNFILERTQYLMFKIYRRKMLLVIIKCHFRLGLYNLESHDNLMLQIDSTIYLP